ncbi:MULTISPECIES: hypothetical protein [unclassified Kitasatospora]|uniref:hypothetical protein n=1 Tax=unclassified Kitasatospora TaxID=2633591 RepID=UPI0024760981|nr:MULTISPECIES: hypothetical protein [unclassified Kitasatospora]MDH6123851.1 tetratricopeptide (TPR) repeat protein [Kitasatospora sp. GP82]MDH6576050.1 tetratricopeptide (TPR) repeat protein [Kitasatospora sp. MAP5-34]
MAAKQNTDTIDPAKLTEEVTALIERITAVAIAGEDTTPLKEEAEALIKQLPTKDRTKLRAQVRKAAESKPAPEPSTEVAVTVPASYHDVEGLDELVQMGAAKVREGISSLAKGSEVAKEIGNVLLDMRRRIVNPKTELPDLRADTDMAKKASSDMFQTVEAAMKEAGNFNQEVMDSYKKSIRTQTAHIVVHYVAALDQNPDEAQHFFAKALERNPDMSPTEAVRKECKISDKSEIDKARERAQAKSALAAAKKALEAGEEAEMDEDEARAIVDAATIAPIDKAMGELSKATKAFAAALKMAGQLGEDDVALLKETMSKWLEEATVAKAKL